MVKLGKKSILSLLIAIVVLCIILKVLLVRAENTIINSFAEKVVVVNQDTPFQITYNGLDISFGKRSFTLKGVLILPDSLVQSSSEVQPHISVSTIHAKDFKLFPLLLKKSLDISKIQVDSLEVAIKKRSPVAPSKEKDNVRKKENSNKVLRELLIREIEFSHFSLIEISANKIDTLQSLKGELLSIQEIDIVQESPEAKVFSFNLERLSISALNQTLYLNTNQTRIELGQMTLDVPQGKAEFANLKIGEVDSLKTISKRQHFNTPVTSANIQNLKCFGIQFDSLWQSKTLFVDSVQIKNAEISMLKNQNKPWNKEVVMPLPQQLLRKQKTDFWFGKIRVADSQLNYIELEEKESITIPIEHLNLEINSLGTKDAYFEKANSDNMDVQMNGKLFGTISFHTHLSFENPMKSDAFKFTGRTGPFKFESFNPIMVPTSNIKFESGHVSRLDFSGSGNHLEASGEFIMRFKDLETVVLKKKSAKVNKTFSWLANSAVQKENPKNGKLRVAQMDHKRVLYKGFGNYMFKTIESGLINSVYPFGKRKVVREE